MKIKKLTKPSTMFKLCLLAVVILSAISGAYNLILHGLPELGDDFSLLGAFKVFSTLAGITLCAVLAVASVTGIIYFFRWLLNRADKEWEEVN